MTKKPLVAIFGCGPSGLLVAHACATNMVPYVVFSRAVKSQLGGAQFSHIAIPPFHDEIPDATLEYQVEGDADVYQQKVYGDAPVPFVSMEHVYDGKKVPAWNLRSLYDQLWDRYGPAVVDIGLDAKRVEQIADGFDLVFTSVPAPTLCRAALDPSVNHWFRHQTIRIHNEALANIPDNVIVYDGTKDHSWYRMSKIFGVGATEWGASSPIPPLETRTVSKPLGTNCDCHSALIRVGRFGTWSKGVLTYHAWNQASEVIEEWGTP